MTGKDLVVGIAVVAGLIAIKTGLGLKFPGSGGGSKEGWPVEFRQSFAQGCIGSKASRPDVVHLCNCLTGSIEKAGVVKLNMDSIITPETNKQILSSIQSYMESGSGQAIVQQCQASASRMRAPAGLRR